MTAPFDVTAVVYREDRPNCLCKQGLPRNTRLAESLAQFLPLFYPKSHSRPTNRNHEAMYLCSQHSSPRISLGQIPKGYAGTKKTVAYITDLIKEGAKDFCVRQTAIDILFESGVPPKDYLGEIRTLFAWVQNNVRYTRDIYRVELLHSARRMLELRAGDCDDMTILLAAMLKAIGHPVRLVLVGFNPKRKAVFTHIYLEAFYKGWWIPLDPTMHRPPGWAPPADHKQVFPVD